MKSEEIRVKSFKTLLNKETLGLPRVFLYEEVYLLLEPRCSLGELVY